MLILLMSSPKAVTIIWGLLFVMERFESDFLRGRLMGRRAVNGLLLAASLLHFAVKLFAISGLGYLKPRTFHLPSEVSYRTRTLTFVSLKRVIS